MRELEPESCSGPLSPTPSPDAPTPLYRLQSTLLEVAPLCTSILERLSWRAFGGPLVPLSPVRSGSTCPPPES